MGNNVIVAVGEELARRGFLAMAFNYRGVGESEGGLRSAAERYEAWESEREWRETGETDDVVAAFQELERRAGNHPIVVVGYSFGAFLALRAARDGRIRPAMLVAVAPPVDDVLAALDQSPANVLLLYGDRDFASPHDRVQALRPSLPSRVRLETMTDCDHFFIGSEGRLSRSVADAVEYLECAHGTTT